MTMVIGGFGDAVTTEEITGYWARRGWTTAKDITRDMVADIKAHRELYDDGEVYRDAEDTDWLFESNGTVPGFWFAFGVHTQYPYDAPVRPLRKLVPQPCPQS